MKQRISYNEKVSRILEKPYIKTMKDEYGIYDKIDQEKVLRYIYGDIVGIHIYSNTKGRRYSDIINIYDSRGVIIYNEFHHRMDF